MKLNYDFFFKFINGYRSTYFNLSYISNGINVNLCYYYYKLFLKHSYIAIMIIIILYILKN